ncbi:MAG: UbiD-type (de) carboxylyase-like protein [Acidobacteria bacterium RIFCSPLOWO2_12_FULL_60_22]|nr:MAG: UbiD-type (de) carboxylyase-like protein [Acidobacteria bacterium RIFCSPLOWO2_12_FULL_60_22]
MMRDLRTWLKQAEELGELQVITEELDWDEETSALNYMVGQREGAPALLYEKIKDAPPGFRALHNLFGTSKERIAATFGLPRGKPLTELIDMVRSTFQRKVPPRVIPAEQAPVNENVVRGDKADITIFPAPKMWPLDGGRYLGTWDVFITRDLEDGHLNLGTYRQMVKGPRELFVYWSPGKDARLQAERYWQRGLPFPVAAAYGPDPLLFAVSSTTLPKTESEYDYAGGLINQPIEVFESDVTGLLIPASAEIVIEGEMRPGNNAMEGPFGEFTGYYGRPEAQTPIIDVKCVRYRRDPILTCALMADYPACEQSLLFSVVRSARIWADLEKLGVPGIRGVASFPEAAGGFGATAISIEQRYAGHASQVAALAAQVPGGAYYAKFIIVVDEDVDPTDIHQVFWAMSTRCSPEKDIDILRSTWSTYLDPTKNPPEERPYGSKALINACKEHKHLKQFSRRSRIRREVYEKVLAKWEKFGLKFPPPVIRNFEED